MYNEKICQRLRANSVVSAWENQRLLRCEKWPRKEKTCRRTKCWNKATNDSNQLRRARIWTFRFPRLIEAVWTHPTSQLLFKSMNLRQDFTLWGQKLELWTHGSQETNSTWWTKSSWTADDSWRSWKRHTQCERSCLSPQQHAWTRIFEVPLPNCLADKEMQMHQGLCQVQFLLS